MAGQWEVVGKKKDRSGGKIAAQKPQQNAAAAAKGQKKTMEINVEDVLNVNQLKNIYSNKNNKENQKPQIKQENGVKKPKKEKIVQEAKPKPPKSIESALNQINVEEFNSIYEKNKALFPDTPIVWLKELAQFLNLRVELQDPIFSNKPENYPISIMPTAIRTVLDKAVKDAGANNTNLFFDICLTTMANDMNKDLSALGHKFFLQYLALHDPKIVLNNISKYVALRNSYQNRQSIGLSILWALGQAGFKDLNVGMKIFQELMLPLVEMKNYSRYVLKYLINLVNKHKDSALSKEQVLMILDIIYAAKKNSASDINKELIEFGPKVGGLIFQKETKYNGYVEPFLKKIAQTDSKPYKNQLCDILVTCIEKDPSCLGTWGKIYTKYLSASAALLSYIEQNWKSVSSKINIKIFAELLKTYNVSNDELMLKKRKEDGLLESVDAIKKVMAKMANKKTKGGFIPFSFLFFLFIASSFLIYFDCERNGGWQNSATSNTLNRTGVYHVTNQALDRAMDGTKWVHNRIEENFPGITEATIEFTTPYIELGRDLGVTFRNVGRNAQKAVKAKIPVILETIDIYAPGLIDQTIALGDKTCAFVRFYDRKIRDYLLKEVFVGKLSPKEINRVLTETYDSSLEKATELYHWIYEKVNTAIIK